MANPCYWVGGSGTWDNTPGNWSSTSGGAVNTSLFPTAADPVYFLSNSGTGTITIGNNAVCGNLSISAMPTGLMFTCPSANSVNIYGNLTSDTSAKSGATFTGSISGTTLTVSAITSGIITVNSQIAGTDVSLYTVITAQVSGTTGGVGVYTVDTSQTTSSTTINTVSNYLNLNFVAVAPTTTQTATNTSTNFLGGVTVNGDNINYNLALGQVYTLDQYVGTTTLSNNTTVNNPSPTINGGRSYISTKAFLIFSTGKVFTITNGAYENYFYADATAYALSSINISGATLNIGTNPIDFDRTASFYINTTAATPEVNIVSNSTTAITVGYQYCAWPTTTNFNVSGQTILGIVTLNNTFASIQSYSGTTYDNTFGTLVRNGAVNKGSTFILYGSNTNCDHFNISGNSDANRLYVSNNSNDRYAPIQYLNSTSTSIASALTNCDIEALQGTVGKPVVVTSVGDLGRNDASYLATGIANFTGSISGTTLNVTAITQGLLIVGATLSGVTGLVAGTFIVSQTSGTTGGIGVYVVSVSNSIGAGTLIDTIGVTYYAVTAGNNFNWSNAPASGGMWATTSGGVTTTGRIPLPQDRVIFDTNSGSGYVTPDIPRLPKITVTSTYTGNFSQYGEYIPSDGATITTTSTTGDFSFTASLGLTVAVGQAIFVQGINTGGSGLTAGTYKVSATNNNSTFKLVKIDGTAITTVNAKPSTGLTLTPSTLFYDNSTSTGYITTYYIYGSTTTTTLIPDDATVQKWYNYTGWNNPGGFVINMNLRNVKNQTFPTSYNYKSIIIDSAYTSTVYTFSASSTFTALNVYSGTVAFGSNTVNLDFLSVNYRGAITATAGLGTAIVKNFIFNQNSFLNTNLLVNMTDSGSFNSVNGGFYKLKFTNSTGSRTSITVSVGSGTTFAQGWTNNTGNINDANININLYSGQTYSVSPFDMVGNATYYLALIAGLLGQANLTIPASSATYYISYQGINATNTIRAYGYLINQGNNTNILFIQGGASFGYVIG